MKKQVWYSHYDPGVPRTLEPYPRRTLLDVFTETVIQRPDHACAIFEGKTVSYREADNLSSAMAAALASRGIRKGSVVAIALPNCTEMLVAQLGTWKAGGIAAPLNPLYTAEELEKSIVQCGASAVVLPTPLYPEVKAFQSHSPRLRHIIPTEIKGYRPTGRARAAQLRLLAPDERVILHHGDLAMDDLLAQYYDSELPAVSISVDDVALVLQSGGTTGTPRDIMLTHGAIMAEALQLRAWISSLIDEWTDVILLGIPMFHVFGNVAIMATAMVGHNPLALVPDPRDHDDLVTTIQRVKPALLPGVPTFFRGLLSHPDVASGKIDFGALKLCISGAARLPQDLRDQFGKVTGARVIQGYGLTETSGAVTAEPALGREQEGSVGLPLPDVMIRIVDSETGRRDLPHGKEGEIIIKCPQLMLGFWNSLEDTAEMLRDGWLYTGDIGYLDQAGYLFIMSRKKDLIKVSGFQVWPSEVVAVLREQPCVADACVLGIPDAVQGESVKAFVVLRPGDKCTAEELKEYCRTRLTAYKVPKYIQFVDELPTGMTGETLCSRLREGETPE